LGQMRGCHLKSGRLHPLGGLYNIDIKFEFSGIAIAIVGLVVVVVVTHTFLSVHKIDRPTSAASIRGLR